MKNTAFRLTPGMIVRRGHYIYHFTQWIYGLVMDYRLAGRSLSATVFYPAEGAYPVQCITYHYIRELLRAVPFSPEDVFVDVGCAWGRLIGYMRAHTKVRHFIGVELNHDAAVVAKEIFTDDPRVTIVEGNILDNLPPEGTFYYLFNPFDAVVLGRFLDLLERKEQGSVKILYLHPTCKAVFEGRSRRWKAVLASSLQPPHMGALEFVIYELLPKDG